MKSYKKGFSLSDLLITVFIVILVITLSVQIFVSLNYNYQTIATYLTSYIKGRQALDIISKDCRIAIRIPDSFSGYTTATNCLILKVPSIDSSHNIIDIDNKFDHIIYRLYNGDLWKIIIPGTGSARAPQNKIFEKSAESFTVSSDGVLLSAIAHKSSITHITVDISIAEMFRGKAYRITPGTTVKLMNYEWEYVR